MIGFAILFMAFASMWTFPIIVETIMSYNPYFAANFIWAKYTFTYLYWKQHADANPTQGIQFWSFNRALPELIGMGFCLIVSSIFAWRGLSSGLGKSAVTGNDGTFDNIRNKKQ